MFFCAFFKMGLDQHLYVEIGSFIIHDFAFIIIYIFCI